MFDLKKFRNDYKLKQSDLQEILGVTQGFISRVENGRELFPKSYLDKLTKKFGEDIAAKYYIEGEIRKPTNEVTPVPEDAYMMVEYADLRATAGRLGDGDVKQLPETHRRLVPKEYENGKFLVVRVDGDSMDDGSKRSLSDGDEVLIAEKTGYKIDELPIKKTLFVITSREGNVLKQIKEVNMGEGYITCHSFNPRYEDFKINMDDIFQIFIVCKVTQKQISLV